MCVYVYLFIFKVVGADNRDNYGTATSVRTRTSNFCTLERFSYVLMYIEIVVSNI